MLARPNRLRQATDIARVYKKGTYGGAGGVLSVKALASGRPTPRVVVVVGKKVSKKAVVRNRIRRRISGEIERRWTTLRAGYDIVISVHTDVSGLTSEALASHLTTAFERARVIQ
jgi:ribonuclease P protein component